MPAKNRIFISHNLVEPGASLDEMDTLVQLEAIEKSLKSMGYDAVSSPFTIDIKSAINEIKKFAPDVIFNLVESIETKGTLINVPVQIFEHLNIPYTGNSSEAIYLTSNKLAAKRLFRSYSIPTPAWISEADSYGFVPGRYILKSATEHASIGIDDSSVVELADIDEAISAIKSNNRKRGDIFYAEQYIDGREFNLSVISSTGGFEVLSPAEMLFVNYGNERVKILNYNSKWVEDSFEYQNTERRFEYDYSDSALLEKIKSISSDCWKKFGLNGYVRVDFRVDADSNPYVIEINANPCITPDSGFTAAAKESGIDYDAMIERIISNPYGKMK